MARHSYFIIFLWLILCFTSGYYSKVINNNESMKRVVIGSISETFLGTACGWEKNHKFTEQASVVSKTKVSFKCHEHFGWIEINEKGLIAAQATERIEVYLFGNINMDKISSNTKEFTQLNHITEKNLRMNEGVVAIAYNQFGNLKECLWEISDILHKRPGVYLGILLMEVNKNPSPCFGVPIIMFRIYSSSSY